MNHGRKGLCFVCGKSTRLNIHAKCSKSIDAAKIKEKTGFGTFNQKHKQTSTRNAAKRNYGKGRLPPFCFE